MKKIVMIAIAMALAIAGSKAWAEEGASAASPLEIGAVFGTGIGPTLGVHLGPIVAHVSGMSLHYAEASIGYKFNEDGKKYHAVAVGYGTNKVQEGKASDTNFTYAGIAYQYRSSGGFYAEIGPAVTVKNLEGKSGAPWMLGQIGYTWRW